MSALAMLMAAAGNAPVGYGAPAVFMANASNTPYITVCDWDDTGNFQRYTNPGYSGLNASWVRFVKSTRTLLHSLFATGNILQAWHWTDAGPGSKYPEMNTVVSIPGNLRNMALPGDEKAIVVLTDVSPYLFAIHWSASGWGVRYTDPATPLPAATNYLEVSPTNDIVLCGLAASPYVVAYEWNSTTGFGSVLPAPAAPPSSSMRTLKIHPDGNSVVISFNASPYIRCYELSPAGIGAFINSPPTTPTSSVNSLEFSNDGNYLFIGQSNGTVKMYPYSSATGIGANLTSQGISGSINALVVSPDDTFLITGNGTSTSPILRQFPITPAGIGTVLPVGSSSPGSVVVTTGGMAICPTLPY